MKRLSRIGLVGALVGFYPISFVTAQTPPMPKAPDVKPESRGERYENLELFQKVLQFTENNYVEPTKNKELMYGAIKGMLETLDPHSNFLPPEIFRDMKIDTSGKFGGLGIELGVQDGILTVIAPIEDTPAWKAGIQAGDRIVKVDGESTKGLTLVEAVAKMRGKTGSDVLLSIYREGFKKIRDYRIKRELVKIQSVKSEEIEPGFAYIRLSSFNENAAEDVERALELADQVHVMEHGRIALSGTADDVRRNPALKQLYIGGTD